ncbi:MAG: hypothetical protein JJT89_00280 [Nitriliruptoraceae bacterium]|nr:hypothetical protein [Nitriliruptoraceae bacterium]
MRARRRNRANGNDRNNQPGAKAARSKQKGNNRARNGNRRSKPARGPNEDAAAFWGRVADLPEPTTDLKLAADPAAVPRSLGTPPLPGQEHLAGHYFAAVYERSVQTAGALAAAGGLVDPAALVAQANGEDED